MAEKEKESKADAELRATDEGPAGQEARKEYEEQRAAEQAEAAAKSPQTQDAT